MGSYIFAQKSRKIINWVASFQFWALNLNNVFSCKRWEMSPFKINAISG